MAPATTVRVGPAPFIAVDRQGEGPLVVFLHGIGGNRTNWSEQLPVFASGFTALAWDARGYGDSDDYPGPLAFADFSADLARVLDHFGAKRAHLIGLSMGARIALDFYGRHPARVASLVLANTSAAQSKAGNEERIEAFLRVRRSPLLEGKEPRDIAPSVAQTLAGPAIAPARLERLVLSLSALRRDSYLKTLDTVTRYEGYPPLASIAVPCLVIAGGADPVAPAPVVRALADSIPGARFVSLPGTGHVSNLEDPVAFNAAARAFLETVAGR